MELAFTLICSVAGLWFAVYLAKWVLRNDEGTKEMQNISDAIREGAEAFLARQYKTIALLTIPVAVVLYLLYALRQSSGQPNISTSQFALYVAGSFILGAICSGIAGYIGMWVAIRANIRTAAASRSSLNLGLQIALRGGAVSGLFVVVMSLLGVGGLFTLLRIFGIPADNKFPFSSLATALAPVLWRSLPNSAVASTPRPPTWGQTWWARSKRVSRKTIRATRRLSPIWWGITSAIALAVAPTCSNRRRQKILAR